MQLQLIVAIIVAILAVVFALQNAIPIAVSFLTWEFKKLISAGAFDYSCFGHYNEFIGLSAFDDKEKKDNFQSKEEDSRIREQPSKRE